MVTLVFLTLSGSGILLFADFLWRGGIYGLKYALLGLFAILFSYLCFGFTTSLFGFLARLRMGRYRSIDSGDIKIPQELPRTALLFPVYNEDPVRVFAGLRATYDSLCQTGRDRHFDFYILSDSTNPDRWVQEEMAWFRTCRELGAFGRIFYRHRPKNTAKKAGNISDFLTRWGSLYRYMIIFDADSLMTGESLTKLVALMEENPTAGIIQTVPTVVDACTPFARAQQFAGSLYGPVFAAGLDYWENSEGNYWGHNAIIRVDAFIRHCELPELPWREPLGGKILSHDFVEAALMRKAGYKVWLAANLHGSYEEGPPNGIEAAQRDRRWCQGNLQHTWLLFARKFSWVSRVHFLNGILSYASGFIWFWFLAVSTLAVVQFINSGLTLVTIPGFMGVLEFSMMGHGLLLLGITAFLLFSPKVFSLVDLALDSKRKFKFGGVLRAAAGAVTETLFSALQAPLNMIWHTLFIITIPLGKGTSWSAQNRSAAGGISFKDAARAYWWISATAAAWAALIASYNLPTFLWMAPVLFPLILAIPLTVFTSSPRIGLAMRHHGLWTTPEENQRPEILCSLDEQIGRMEKLLQSACKVTASSAIADPAVHTVHMQIESSAQAHVGTPPDELASATADGDTRLLLLDTAKLQTAHMAHWTGM